MSGGNKPSSIVANWSRHLGEFSLKYALDRHLGRGMHCYGRKAQFDRRRKRCNYGGHNSTKRRCCWSQGTVQETELQEAPANSPNPSNARHLSKELTDQVYQDSTTLPSPYLDVAFAPPKPSHAGAGADAVAERAGRAPEPAE